MINEVIFELDENTTITFKGAGMTEYFRYAKELSVMESQGKDILKRAEGIEDEEIKKQAIETGNDKINEGTAKVYEVLINKVVSVKIGDDEYTDDEDIALFIDRLLPADALRAFSHIAPDLVKNSLSPS